MRNEFWLGLDPSRLASRAPQDEAKPKENLLILRWPRPSITLSPHPEVRPKGASKERRKRPRDEGGPRRRGGFRNGPLEGEAVSDSERRGVVFAPSTIAIRL